MTASQLVPALVLPLIGWRVYVRLRRNTGRQPFHRSRWWRTLIVFSVIAGLIGLGAMRSPPALGGLAGGLALGVALAVIAFKLTRWESTPAGNFYTPNLTIGLAVTLIFIGRLTYRIIALLSLTPAQRMAMPDGAFSFQNPLTLLTFGITAGFYIAYNASLLLHAQKKI